MAAVKGLLSAGSRKTADVVLHFLNWIPIYVFIANWPDFLAHKLLQRK